MTHHPLDVRAILSAEALAKLRARYDRRVFRAAGRSATVNTFSEAAPFFDALLEKFYDQSCPLSAVERELIIMALFTSRTPAWMLSVHVYVALMEGLAVEKIAGAILLAALYHHGLGAYTDSIGVVQRTLVQLSELADLSDEKSDAQQTDSILAALRARSVS